jgi:uncharacterized protein involved in type VI secretion and phage assembly
MTDVPSAGPIHRPLIKIAGTALAPEVVDCLLDCRVDLAVSRAGQAVLRFIDEEFRLLDSALLTVGKALTISLANASNALKPTFDGEILNVGLETGPNDEPIVTVTAFDKSHRLARNSVNTVHANKTYSDLVQSLATAAGMQSDCTATSTTFPYLLQTMNSAALLNEIAERTGMVWWVEGQKLVMKKPVTGSPAVTLERGKALRRVRAVSSAGTVSDEVTVRSWDQANKQVIVGQSTNKPTALSNTSLVSGTRSGASTFSTSKRTSTTRPSLSSDEATAVAQSLHQRAISEELNLRADSEGNADIKVGATVELKGLGTRISGNYFVTAVEHVYSLNDYRTKFTSAGTTPSTLIDLLGTGSSVPWHRMGPVAGVVSDLGKDEFVGLVKVKLSVLGENVVTNWARVLSPGAGAQRGSLLMPSINDEVLVMFEDGDLRRPVVLGAMWNGKDKQPLPVVEDGKVVQWVTKSVTGHTLTFNDGAQDNKKSVVIALSDDTVKLNLGMDKVELWAKNDTPLQLKSNQATITIKGDGNIEIKGKGIKLTADEDVEITGANVKITGNQTAVMKGNSSVEVSGGQAKLAGSGPTEIKGAIVKIN